MKLSAIDKNTIRFYNQHAQDYSNAINNKANLKQIEDFCGYLKKSSSTILDIGCASGRDSRIFRDKGMQVVGIDAAKKLIEIARSLDHISVYKTMDMRELKFSDGYFDAVYAAASILHLPNSKDVRSALNEFFRVMKPHGYLYISLKLQLGKKKFESVKEERSHFIPRFFQYFTQEEITGILKKLGFNIVSAKKRKSSRGTHITWLDIIAQKST